MPADPGIVIIGASLAGAKAAQALRLDHGYDGPIALVDDEPHLPYQRPALSKGCLLGTTGAGDLDVVEPQFYADQDITLALGAPATALDGVCYLRNRDDSEHLATALRAATNVVIVGAGWIGSELAAASRSLGNHTTVIDPLPTPRRPPGVTAGRDRRCHR
ncbi:FAD-dependent oxidoreductase [Nonomuraea sp. NPDC049784]|uniref:FAD-dependent oxidoreductase n=1 Tax=Nonomuraea sp. NPDC049784 TaxID=3154361 RepID=UPI00340D103B